MIYSCCDEHRHNAVRQHPTLNGIDYLEVLDDPSIPNEQRLRTLYVHCMKPLDGKTVSKELVRVEGGERIRDIVVTGVAVGKDTQANVLLVQVNKPGDFSIYTLRLLVDGARQFKFDPLLSSVDFTFQRDADSDFDCQVERPCSPEMPELPEINYMAKDYLSFRQLMLDRMAVTLPQWQERSPADLEVVLIELLAYVADYLSYQQDVIVTESYLTTARRRISVGRHARLLDYPMSEGSNARVWVQVAVKEDIQKSSNPRATAALPMCRQFLTKVAPLDTLVAPNSQDYNEALALQTTIFETVYDVDNLFAAHNEMQFYTWGARECCLPKGTTRATLLGHFPNLQVGDVLIFEEIYGPHTGATEDADITHRCAVRLTKVKCTHDPLGKWFTQAEQEMPAQPDKIVELVEQRKSGEVIEKRGEEEKIKVDETEKVVEASSTEAISIPEKEEVSHEEVLGGPEDTVKLRVSRLKEALKERDQAARRETADEGSRAKEGKKKEDVEEKLEVTDVEAEETRGGKRKKGQTEREEPEVTDVEIKEGDKKEEPQEVDYSLAVTEIEWHVDDALPFPLCISTTTAPEHGQDYIENVSVAYGNIVLADHGQTIEEECFGPVPTPKLFRVLAQSGDRCQQRANIPVLPRFYPSLQNTVLTYVGPAIEDKASVSASATIKWADTNPGTAALPAIIKLTSTLGDEKEISWQPMPDLLHCEPTTPAFVVEIESNGTAYLRFGDGRHGMFPAPGTQFKVKYRVGNGVVGNIGADSLAHIVDNEERIVAIRNPLPAKGGMEPESVEDVRQKAPGSFLRQARAVTTEDYVTLAERYPGVCRAAAVQLWTGSWSTTFLAVERTPGAGVDDQFKKKLHQYMEQYRMAGSELVVFGPVYVSIEIAMTVQVKSEYFRNQVKAALMDVFSNRILPDGERGVFYSDNFTFGQPVYLSPLRSAALAVPGVDWVEITKFQRQSFPSHQGLKEGVLAMDWMEIARLENNPLFQEHGLFSLKVEGGK